ncbi:type II toxin-antitoxin system CcdA family antitoxin [Lentzea sp. NBC_00516]|uniref:hypothetical protein n=1 Tax=Lentzea sp. NBC_00516 TaxID=2903582 RepID=UPI002E8204B1|nr:hypothetical protein [Lentzea sp. NBC_00516]WUD21458.1 type II toxin-antitoxin system CcdA family antitoxin [Lentzea sp. NBC_00516]
MPEQTTLSIKVEVAPQVAGGLSALVEKLLASAVREAKRKDRDGGRGPVVNKHSGTVHGTLFQIGNVEGNVHYRDR